MGSEALSELSGVMPRSCGPVKRRSEGRLEVAKEALQGGAMNAFEHWRLGGTLRIADQGALGRGRRVRMSAIEVEALKCAVGAVSWRQIADAVKSSAGS